MKSQSKALLLACLVGELFATCIPLLADSNSTVTNSWGHIRYTHWPTKVRYGPGYQNFYAIMQTTLPNQKIKVDLLQNGWYAVFKPSETNQSTIIGYIPASDVYPQPLTNAHQFAVNTIDSTSSNDYAVLLQDAMSLAAQGKYDKAVEAAGTALAFARKTLGSNHPDVATCLVTLGHVYQLGQHYAIAQVMYEQAVEIDRISVGTNSFLFASDLNNVALCRFRLKEYKEAEVLFEKSIAICKVVTGEQSDATTQILRNLAVLYKETDRPDLAAECKAKIELNMRGHTRVVNTSPGGIGFSDEHLKRDRHILEPELRRIEGVIRRTMGSVNPYTPPEWQ